MDKYEYTIHHDSKDTPIKAYKAVCDKLTSHLWQIRDVDEGYELRSSVEGYYLSPRPAHRADASSSVKKLVTASSGTYGPIYIVLRNREGSDALTIVGNKKDVLQAAFILRAKA
jgi:hypothetical protein